jgi:transcriptional regulator with XRE-family HTH domain
MGSMEVASALRAARKSAGLSQRELAARAGTSQATVSAYENGAKEPSVATFSRLLAAAGARLAVETTGPTVAEPSASDLRRSGRTLAQVIALAEALPAEHAPELRYPRLARRAAA